MSKFREFICPLAYMMGIYFFHVGHEKEFQKKIHLLKRSIYFNSVQLNERICRMSMIITKEYSNFVVKFISRLKIPFISDRTWSGWYYPIHCQIKLPDAYGKERKKNLHLIPLLCIVVRRYTKTFWVQMQLIFPRRCMY